MRWDEEWNCFLAKIKSAIMYMCGVCITWRVCCSIQIHATLKRTLVLQYGGELTHGVFHLQMILTLVPEGHEQIENYFFLFLFVIHHACQGCTLQDHKFYIPAPNIFSAPRGAKVKFVACMVWKLNQDVHGIGCSKYGVPIHNSGMNLTHQFGEDFSFY